LVTVTHALTCTVLAVAMHASTCNSCNEFRAQMMLILNFPCIFIGQTTKRPACSRPISLQYFPPGANGRILLHFGAHCFLFMVVENSYITTSRPNLSLHFPPEIILMVNVIESECVGVSCQILLRQFRGLRERYSVTCKILYKD
jgi:hypothetical protein